MKAILSIFLLVSAAATHAQSHLEIKRGDQRLGYATISQSLDADGSKSILLRMQLTAGKDAVSIRTESRFDQAGMPLRKFQETTVTGSPAKQLIATFPAAGAKVVIIDGDARKVKDIDLVADSSRANRAEFWFIRDTPAVGATEKSYQFNLDKLEWEIAVTTFKGRKSIKVGRTTYDANWVVEERGGKSTTSYLDEQGLPILITTGDLKLARISK